MWAFEAEVVEWRGPAPHHFAPMPPDLSEDLKNAARDLVYWGQVPVLGRVGATDFETALFPRHGRYLVPLKAAVRRAERIGLGDVVRVELWLPPRG